VTPRQFPGELLGAAQISRAPSEVGNDPNGEWVAANAGEVFAQQVGGPTELSGGCRADHLDVMALPVHLAAADESGRCSGDGTEIGESEAKSRIGLDCETERRKRLGGVRGLLCLAIVVGGPIVGGDHPTVVLDGWPDAVRPTSSIGGLLWVSVHAPQCGPGA
jgi:hypothetical protein